MHTNPVFLDYHVHLVNYTRSVRKISRRLTYRRIWFLDSLFEQVLIQAYHLINYDQ